MICAAPDYLPIFFVNFISNFFNLFSFNKYPIKLFRNGYMKLIGYSCRSLFHTCMEYFKKDDLVVVTTPLHHTSFRNIITLFVKPENIHIIEMNDSYNEIVKFPDVERCDLVIITHLFGMDLEMPDMEEFKEKHKCIFIEDRAQGGEIHKEFSENIFDIAFYSCGMDKRPVALGGGFVNIKDSNMGLINFMETSIKNYKTEPVYERFLFLLKKIPTYLLYNSRWFIYFLIRLLNMFNYSLTKFAQKYREKNPGFDHNNYLKQPSNALLKSVHCNLNKYVWIEFLYEINGYKFMHKMNSNVKKTYFPWYKNINLLTPYNTIFMDVNKINEFMNYMEKLNICVIKNPTYKVFDHNYDNKMKDETFNNSLLYIPSLGNMTGLEMIFLGDCLNNFMKQ